MNLCAACAFGSSATANRVTIRCMPALLSRARTFCSSLYTPMRRREPQRRAVAARRLRCYPAGNQGRPADGRVRVRDASAPTDAEGARRAPDVPPKLSGNRNAAGRAPGARERPALAGGQGDGDIALSFDVKGRRVTDRDWRIVNPGGSRRVVVTKELPGERWLQLLTAADCRVEIAQGDDILAEAEIRAAIGEHVRRRHRPAHRELVGGAARAPSRPPAALVYSQYAVGYDNVDVAAATRARPARGQHARRAHRDDGGARRRPHLRRRAAHRRGRSLDARRRATTAGCRRMLLGSLLYRGTVGIVGAGRIGAAYARMMVEGHKMDLVYYDVRPNEELEGSRRRLRRLPRGARRAAGDVPPRRDPARSCCAPPTWSASTPRSPHETTAPHRRPRAGGDEGGRHPRQRQPRPARRRGRARRALPHPPALPRRPRRLRERAGHGAWPRRARQRRPRPAPRLGHDLDARGHGDPRGRQRRRDPPAAGRSGRPSAASRTSRRSSRAPSRRTPPPASSTPTTSACRVFATAGLRTKEERQ